ncbi:MAG TPA: carbohydrate-binding module family 20 domain-containing protein, partial [Chitinophagaceae bacterium]|nr:carbohydrate-binding module family 20 domain-containing protein [Chitinophagaceae bacterium]
MIKIQFYLRFHTRYGQSIWITGNADELGNNDPSKAIAMNYLNDEFWHGSIEINRKNAPKNIVYKYILKNEDGELLFEWGHDRNISLLKDISEITTSDIWNHAGEYENSFFTAPFKNVLLKEDHSKIKADSDKDPTHIFRVKAPLLKKGEALCLLGSNLKLGDWSTDKPMLLGKNGDWWEIKLNLLECSFPIAYKYGVYNTKEKSFIGFENGDNRILYTDAAKKKLSILHDGFVQFPNDTWKG